MPSPSLNRNLPHQEVHRSGRAVWLRAAVLGSDDAIVSTANLMLGVAVSSAPKAVVAKNSFGDFRALRRCQPTRKPGPNLG